MSYSVNQGVVRYCNDLVGGGCHTHAIKDAEVSSFVILNRTWAKDQKHVWANGRPVRKVYVESFEALNSAFGRDNECVFDSLGRLVKGLNAFAFEVLDDGLQHRAAGGCTDASYARCEGKIYHYEWGMHRTMWLRGAEAETFRALKWNYGCDRRRVYSSRWLVKGADSNTYRQITPYFAVDERSVFYFNRAIPEADPQTFEAFDSAFWSTADVEAAALQGGRNFWAKDAHRVYHQDRVVAGADPKTAVPVGDLIKDERHVYRFLGRPVKVADTASFEAIGCGVFYFRDKKHIYCDGMEWKTIPGADLETFEELPARHPSRGDAWDRNWIYRNRTERWRPRNEFTS